MVVVVTLAKHTAGKADWEEVAAEAVMKLIGYFRSSAAYRVRIALNLKGIVVEHASRHLRKGEQKAPDYAAINPQKLVPALVLDIGKKVWWPSRMAHEGEPGEHMPEPEPDADADPRPDAVSPGA